MFDIKFVATEPERQKEGWDALRGKVTLGDCTEEFLASLQLWNRSAYERHWLDAACRLLNGAGSTCFVTSAFQFRWLMWAMDNDVVVQEQLMWGLKTDEPMDPDSPYWAIGDYVRSEDGQPISEWRLPLGSLRTFADQRALEYGAIDSA